MNEMEMLSLIDEQLIRVGATNWGLEDSVYANMKNGIVHLYDNRQNWMGPYDLALDTLERMYDNVDGDEFWTVFQSNEYIVEHPVLEKDEYSKLLEPEEDPEPVAKTFVYQENEFTVISMTANDLIAARNASYGKDILRISFINMPSWTEFSLIKLTYGEWERLTEFLSRGVNE